MFYSFTSPEHLHLWPANHHLQKVCICSRPSNHACWCRLADSGRVEGALSKDVATLGEYLQTWKLKLSTTKTASAGFHLNKKEAKRELNVNFNNALLLRAQIPQSNVGQVARAPLTPWATSQEANVTCRTPEAACCLLLGRWNNNVVNSHPSPGPFDCGVLRSCLVLQCSYPPHWTRHQQCLANCDWMPASYTSSRCILNMKRLVTLKYKQRKTSTASSEKQLGSLALMSLNSTTKRSIRISMLKVASPNGLNSRRVKLEQSSI